MAASTPPHPRGRVLTVLLHGLYHWGRRPRLRICLYITLLLLSTIPLINSYRFWLAWSQDPMGNSPASTPSGFLIWFRLEGEHLTPINQQEAGDDAVGLDFHSGESRMHPPSKNLALRVLTIHMHAAQWSDPTRTPAPDLDEMARLLAIEMWRDPATEYTASTKGPGLCELRYCDPAATKAVARATAMLESPTAGIRFLVVVLVGECIAWFGRRITLSRPGECRSCGYPLIGIPSPVCPECGTARAANADLESQA